MKKLIDYLIQLGYIGNGCTSLQFSSVAPNGCWVTFTKDNSRFTFGLNEKGNPPTLIFPKKIYTEHKRVIHKYHTLQRYFTDAEISGYLSMHEPEYIYNDLLKDSIK